MGLFVPLPFSWRWGKGMKVTQNEHRRRTANYEWAEARGGEEEGGREGVRALTHTPTMCPITPPPPNSPAPRLSIFSFSSFLISLYEAERRLFHVYSRDVCVRSAARPRRRTVSEPQALYNGTVCSGSVINHPDSTGSMNCVFSLGGHVCVEIVISFQLIFSCLLWLLGA